jgi:predicted enzyme related to lactoylglutathione lyase
MSSPRFSRFLLRTTDVRAAAEFYDAVLEERGDGIVPLHEAALARGAQPHWLGHIAVRDLGGAEAVAGRLVERGAMRLGPPAGVGDFVVLRDPGGAVVAVTDSAEASSARVVWHQLNTRDPANAGATYTGLFGWALTQAIDLGPLGQHQRFAFSAGEPSVGLISDVANRPEVHTHWLFFWAVPSLDRALERTRSRGGKVVGPIALQNGVRVAACDDPQGAAFGVIEREDAARLATE